MNRKIFIVLLFSFVLMGTDRAFGMTGIRVVGQTLLAPVSYVIYQAGYQTRQISNFVVSLPFVYRENQVWEAKVKKLEADLVNQVELQQENIVLREQLNVLAARDEEIILSRVIGSQTRGDSLVILIDKGQRDGIREGAVVINGNALVGRVIDVMSKTSYVLPVFAVDSRVPVKIANADNQKTIGVIIGKYNDRVVLTDVLQEQVIYPGDLLISSGEGGVFPVGYYVGKVTEVSPEDAAIFKTAAVEASINLDTLTSVFVEK